jgi:RHS repeat-associated protein
MTQVGYVCDSTIYYRARYYDPTIGRFISEDPIRFVGSGTNFYGYAQNNPVNLIDPLGLATGFNFGVTGGVDGGLGLGIGTAALGGGSAGLTFGGGTPIGAYASASGGAAAGPWGAPNQGNNFAVVGGGAAAGVGITFGNATSAGQMRGNALTFGVGVDAGVGGGVQATLGTDAAGHTIWQVNITGGVGFKAYGYSLVTHTVASSTNKGCN